MNKIKNLKEYFPIVYIILICLGYINKSLFFSQFDINIINYLSIQDLVFVFIPLGSMIIGVLVIFLMTIISIWVFSKKSKLEIDYKQSEIELTNLKSKKFYKGLNYLLTTYLYVLPFGLLFNYFFFIYMVLVALSLFFALLIIHKLVDFFHNVRSCL